MCASEICEKAEGEAVLCAGQPCRAQCPMASTLVRRQPSQIADFCQDGERIEKKNEAVQGANKKKYVCPRYHTHP